ncbi:hypothetical protein E2P81_ATG10860 [Venturia nashicola]|nr:hypothetical protein E2P81_ATG10860 [Venturia nashicola]
MILTKFFIITALTLATSITAVPDQQNQTESAVSAIGCRQLNPCQACNDEFRQCIEHCGTESYCPGWCRERMCTNNGDPEGTCRRDCGYDKFCGVSRKKARSGLRQGMPGINRTPGMRSTSKYHFRETIEYCLFVKNSRRVIIYWVCELHLITYHQMAPIFDRDCSVVELSLLDNLNSFVFLLSFIIPLRITGCLRFRPVVTREPRAAGLPGTREQKHLRFEQLLNALMDRCSLRWMDAHPYVQSLLNSSRDPRAPPRFLQNVKPVGHTKRAPGAPPKIGHMLETCLYIRRMEVAVNFYKDILGLENYMTTKRLSGFNIGPTTLLLFHLGDTMKDQNYSGTPGRGQIAGHGPDPSIINTLGLQNSTVAPKNGTNHPEVSLKLHYALAVEKREDVFAWEAHLAKNNVHIHSTMDWDRGGRSVYFYDPDGHVGEIVSRGIWPHCIFHHSEYSFGSAPHEQGQDRVEREFEAKSLHDFLDLVRDWREFVFSYNYTTLSLFLRYNPARKLVSYSPFSFFNNSDVYPLQAAITQANNQNAPSENKP